MHIRGGGIASILIGLVGVNVVCQILNIKINNDIFRDVTSWINWRFPVVLSGYFTASFQIFENLFDKCFNKNWNCIAKRIVWLLLLAVPFVGRYYDSWFTVGYTGFIGQTLGISFSTDLVYAPCFVYALVCIINDLLRFEISNKSILKILAAIGKKSMLMWFIHCIFFSEATKQVFQPKLYVVHNPILVLLWGLILTYIISIPLDKIANFIIRRVIKFPLKISLN